MKTIFRIILTLAFFILISCLSSPDLKYQKANQLREKIIKYDLSKYVEDDFKLAENEYEKVKSFLDSKKNIQADQLLGKINSKYQTIIEKALPICAEDKGEEVGLSRSSCLVLKADVAVKKEYDKAEKLYNTAFAYKEQNQYEKSIDAFNEAGELFEEIYKIMEEKKEKTEKSFDEASESLLEFEASVEEFENRISVIKKELKKESSK